MNFRLTLVHGGHFNVRGCGGRSVLNDAVFLYGCLVVLEGVVRSCLNEDVDSGRFRP